MAKYPGTITPDPPLQPAEAPHKGPIEQLTALFERSEPVHAPGMLVAGFTWDWLTLTRIDALSDNLFLLAYLTLLAVLLVVERRIAHGVWVPGFLRRHPRWVFLASQFFFGGLYSAYVIYYAKSSGSGKALLYLGLLGLLLVMNELADRHLRGDLVRFALFFFCAFSFLLFFVPVTTGVLIGFGTAGFGALLLTAPVVAAVHLFPGQTSEVYADGGHVLGGLDAPRAIGLHGAVHVALLLVLVLLGRGGLIPPVPLSLQHGDVYHDVTLTPEGYQLTWEPRGLLGYGRTFHWQGDVVWCFTAVFAPVGMNLDIQHVWERWQPDGGWQVTDRIAWSLKGGREAGYRGYTHKRHVTPGAWRVRVTTGSGRELGVVRFDVEEGPPKRDLVRRTY